MKIDNAQITAGGFAAQHDAEAGVYRYTATATVVLLQTVDGRLTPIAGDDLAILEMDRDGQPGFRGARRIDFEFPETPDGGSPSIMEVGQSLMVWLGQVIAEVQAQWVGKTVTVVVEESDAPA